MLVVRLPVEQVRYGVDGVKLVRLVGVEFKLHR